MIERETAEGIEILRMAHGKASALDLELCQAIERELEASVDASAVVLTGRGTIFSAGVDLPRLLDGGRDYAAAFVAAFESMLRALFLFPRPVIAAANGHAIAGGAILAFACDYRLMCSGRIGVPEALVGVPFPPAALEICRFAIPTQHLQPMLYLARTVEVDEAKSMGIIDETVLPEQLMPRALAVAKQLGSIPAETFRTTKLQLRAHTSGGDTVAMWSSEAAHQRIRDYLARTIGKRNS